MAHFPHEAKAARPGSHGGAWALLPLPAVTSRGLRVRAVPCKAKAPSCGRDLLGASDVVTELIKCLCGEVKDGDFVTLG